MNSRLTLAALAALAAACATAPQKTAPEVASPSQGTSAASSSRAREAASARDPEAQAALKRSLELSARGDFPSAERELKRIVDRDPRLDYAWTNLGIVYEREALPQQAERAYRKALELKPDQDEAWNYLTRLYARTGRSAQIEGELRGRIQQAPTSQGTRGALVFLLLQQDKYEAAGSEAKKILQADEHHVRGMQLLAQVYFHQGKHELAKMVLENARAIDPNDAVTYNGLGLVNLALKSRGPALENFKQAVALKADFAEAKNNLGAMLNEAQDYDAAIRELEGAVNVAPDFAAARLNLGNAYRGKQENGKALAQYIQVRQLNPELADTYYNLAILHLDSEIPNLDPVARLKTAIAYFDQYRQKGGKDERVEQYLRDATKDIEKEQRRQQRERADQLRKAERPEPAAKPPPSSKLAGKARPSPSDANGPRSKGKLTTPASKLGSDDQGTPAPKPATSGKLEEREK